MMSPALNDIFLEPIYRLGGDRAKDITSCMGRQELIIIDNDSFRRISIPMLFRFFLNTQSPGNIIQPKNSYFYESSEEEVKVLHTEIFLDTFKMGYHENGWHDLYQEAEAVKFIVDYLQKFCDEFFKDREEPINFQGMNLSEECEIIIKYI